MLKLGHIIYSNCFPPHAGILMNAVPFPFQLVEGIPTQLNRMLEDGFLDVSPSSSIEYGIHADRYLILPGFSITSRKNVMSILLESRVPIEDLNNKVVALTSASATSVILLRILLEMRYKARPSYIMFQQGIEDPGDKAAAMLTIGDFAITRREAALYPYRYDLGELWNGFTGLPFVFALWQVNDSREIRKDLKQLYNILRESKTYGLENLDELARKTSSRFNLAAATLQEYWKLFSYDFGPEEQQGLVTFYGYAAELGAIAPVTELHFWAGD